VPSIYTEHHRTELTWLADIAAGHLGAQVVNISGRNSGFPAVMVSGMTISEAEQLAGELQAAVRRARAVMYGPSPSPEADGAETPPHAP
jgi:hypothetical protein